MGLIPLRLLIRQPESVKKNHKKMKNLLFVFPITLLLSCNQNVQNSSYELTGMIEGISSGNVCLMYSDFKDTVKIENGIFIFRGKVIEPYLSKLVFEELDDCREFYLENSKITFKGNIDSIDKSIITGSKTESERMLYNERMAEFDEKYTELEKQYKEAKEINEEELNILYEEIEFEQVDAQRDFIKENPSSYLCISILWEIDWSFNSAVEYNNYVNLLDTSLSKYKRLIDLKKLIARMEKVEIGKTAPDFEIKDSNDNLNRLSELYQKTDYLLLDFWASTCAPCRKENAHIREVYNKFHLKGFEVFGVSSDTNKELWLKAIEKDGLSWTNGCSLEKWGENDIIKTYALRQVSANFLLDNTGKIIAKDLRGVDLEAKLSELLD